MQNLHNEILHNLITTIGHEESRKRVIDLHNRLRTLSQPCLIKNSDIIHWSGEKFVSLLSH